MMFFSEGLGTSEFARRFCCIFLKRKNGWLGRGASSDFGLEMELLRGASLHFVSKSSSRVEHAHILSQIELSRGASLDVFGPPRGVGG